MLTVIAYKENSDDGNRDGTLEIYEADMQWISTDSEEKLVEFISDFKVKNNFSHRFEYDYEFTCINSDGTEYESGDQEFDSILDNAQTLSLYKIEVEAKRREDLRLAAIRRRKEAEEEQQKLRDAKEYAEYVRLHQKYGANA
jgi:hypothetical protein